MKLRIVGCSPAWPNPGGVQSGYLVEEGGRRLLLDCGPGVLARLREGEGWPRVDAIAITHLHLDHWGDLVPWAYGAMYGAGRVAPVPELWLPPGASDDLRGLARIGADAVLDTFEVHEYNGGPFRVAGFEVTAMRTAHYEETSFAFRVTGGDATLAYSADSAPSPSLAELARDADVFLCEATLAQPEALDDRGHMTADAAIEAFNASGARRLLVIHRPDELPLPEGVERAYDGLELE
ncbi:MAG: MBL fold metallo-hydrolase, partial [Gaiellaceae bacterium]